MEKQRKLAAIMFTDIVGYSAQMSKDEVNALQILKKNRDILKPRIEKSNGELLKEMGDGSLSIFSSIVDAVNCAFDIQESLANEVDFKIRIGIHIGDIVVEGKDVFGDGVNVASRIEKLAKPGGICVSGQVYANIRNKRDIEAFNMGQKSLKNIDNPIAVYDLTRKKHPDAYPVSHSELHSTPNTPKSSIAVLPFRDMSPENDQEWFCNGMAEEIINALTHIKSLHVAAFTSTLALMGKHEDIREIGNSLNVKTVLAGSVRKAGKNLRITAQIINVSDGYNLWSESYNREMEDVFEIQDEISLAVVNELKDKLLDEEKDAVVRHYTENLEAYNFYLKGSYNASKCDEEGLKKAVEYYKKAIDKDPDYALAYARLADSYIHLSSFSELPAEAYAKAKEAALKALEIDSKLPEAHAALASIKMDHEWDWVGAAKEYKRAQELDPLLLSIYKFTTGIYRSCGRIDEAFEMSHKSSEIQPDFREIYETIVSLSCKQGNYAEALKTHKKMKEIINEYNAWEMAQLGYIHGINGAKNKAEKILNDLLRKRSEDFPLFLKKAYISLSRKGEDNTEKLLEKIEESNNNEYVPALSIALLYLGLGEITKTFEWLDKAHDELNTLTMFIEIVPELNKIYMDKRFIALQEKMNLPDD